MRKEGKTRERVNVLPNHIGYLIMHPPERDVPSSSKSRSRSSIHKLIAIVAREHFGDDSVEETQAPMSLPEEALALGLGDPQRRL